MRTDVALAQKVSMTGSSTERDRASGSSDEDDGDLKRALPDHILHGVQLLAGKNTIVTVTSASAIVVA